MKSYKEFLAESSGFPKKEHFTPSKGADVRVPTSTVGETVAAKVLNPGRAKGSWQVKTHAGEIQTHPESDVFHPDLSCEQYHKY